MCIFRLKMIEKKTTYHKARNIGNKPALLMTWKIAAGCLPLESI